MYSASIKTMARDGVGPHALRHTAASDVLDRCNNVRTVQEMLGHSSLATTQIYLRRASLGQLREAMEGRDYLAGATVPAEPAKEEP
jgi:site-specific recombinase XerC